MNCKPRMKKIKENTEKMKVNETVPYLVSSVIEVFILCFYVLMWILFQAYCRCRHYCQHMETFTFCIF
jgi:hypothetical protein